MAPALLTRLLAETPPREVTRAGEWMGLGTWRALPWSGSLTSEGLPSPEGWLVIDVAARDSKSRVPSLGQEVTRGRNQLFLKGEDSSRGAVFHPLGLSRTRRTWVPGLGALPWRHLGGGRSSPELLFRFSPRVWSCAAGCHLRAQSWLRAAGPGAGKGNQNAA